MARSRKPEASAPVAAPAIGNSTDEDPGLAELFAKRDAVYAEAAKAQAERDAARSGTPVVGGGEQEDPGLARLFAERDAAYAAHAEAQRTQDEALRRRSGIGSIYSQWVVPPPSDPEAHAKALAASQSAAAEGDEPASAAPARRTRRARKAR